MSRTTNNRRKKNNRKWQTLRDLIVGFAPAGPIQWSDPEVVDLTGIWQPLAINAQGGSNRWAMSSKNDWNNGTGADQAEMFTSKPSCEIDEASYYAGIPNAVEEDGLGRQCDHTNRDGETCGGTMQLWDGPGPHDDKYGPHKCKTCNDTHHNCQRLKCDTCWLVERRYRWMVRHLMQFKVDKPRSMVLWTPLK